MSVISIFAVLTCSVLCFFILPPGITWKIAIVMQIFATSSIFYINDLKRKKILYSCNLTIYGGIIHIPLFWKKIAVSCDVMISSNNGCLGKLDGFYAFDENLYKSQDYYVCISGTQYNMVCELNWFMTAYICNY